MKVCDKKLAAIALGSPPGFVLKSHSRAGLKGKLIPEGGEP
jgi:hypothetical protein